MRMQEKTS